MRNISFADRNLSKKRRSILLLLHLKPTPDGSGNKQKIAVAILLLISFSFIPQAAYPQGSDMKTTVEAITVLANRILNHEIVNNANKGNQPITIMCLGVFDEKEYWEALRNHHEKYFPGIADTTSKFPIQQESLIGPLYESTKVYMEAIRLNISSLTDPKEIVAIADCHRKVNDLSRLKKKFTVIYLAMSSREPVESWVKEKCINHSAHVCRFGLLAIFPLPAGVIEKRLTLSREQNSSEWSIITLDSVSYTGAE